MPTIQIFGIKNCDSVKKALKFFDEHNIEYCFCDYKAQESIINKDIIQKWLVSVGANKLLNKRSTTYRNLSDDDKDKANTDNINIIAELLNMHKTLIKRPVVAYKEQIMVGFNKSEFEIAFLQR